MNRPLVTTLALAVVLWSPASAQEETYTDADAALLDACLAEAPFEEGGTAAYAACIGAASNPCMEEPGGSSTLGMVNCMQREERWWDERLDGELAMLRESAGEDALALLEAAQESWQSYLAGHCEFLYASGEGTIQQLVHASCMLEGTARRAIELVPSY